MRVGSIGYDTVQGLGILLRDFYRNGVVTDVFTVKHRTRPSQGWFPPNRHLRSTDFMAEMDIMFFFEHAFNPSAYEFCRQQGIPTVLMPMYECTLDWVSDGADHIINPSLLDQQRYPRGTYLPVPVEMPWKKREQALTFVHNAGHGGLKGRNGTKELLEALQYVTKPANFIIRSQEPIPQAMAHPTIRLECGTLPEEQLYAEGDVFVFPEKFNGLSLPLQEAYASGMLVMTTNRFPMNAWLPHGPLIPCVGSRPQQIIQPVDEALINPPTIARTIDAWFDQDISLFSEAGRLYGERNSWAVLKPQYLNFLERLL